VPHELYEKMVEDLENYRLSLIVKERLNDNEEPIKVTLDEL